MTVRLHRTTSVLSLRGFGVVGLWFGRTKDFLDESLAFADGRSGRPLGRDTGLAATQAKGLGRVERQT